eukprot:TRINITY_DN16757_c0_g1_i1.p1 TRINITY_DN16757_c0_g1~~TRINITY_DN16757_c0_g1_i1.p1  ORF type:complete len:365 (+),score=74.25 TRINITY_DN16757_c0_g1_i1:103-1197(+)
MSIFIYIHRHPLRTNEEFLAKIVYLLTALGMVTVSIVTFTVWVTGINNTFRDFWSGTSYKLTDTMLSILDGCNYTDTVTIGGRKIEAKIIGETSSQYFLMTAVDYQNTVFGVTLPTVVLSVMNKLLFRSNRWFIRWRGLLIRTNIILPTIEVFMHVWAIVSIVKSMAPADFVSDFIGYCSSRLTVQKQIDTNFDKSFLGLLIVLSINLFVIALGLIRLACDASNDDVAKWAKVRYEDFHRNAKKGIPGIHGNEANLELVPPKRAILKALKYYPEIQAEKEMGERRVDVADGMAYTRSEFVKHYGGTKEWDNAPPVVAQLPPLHDEYETYSPAVAPTEDPLAPAHESYYSPQRIGGNPPPAGNEV